MPEQLTIFDFLAQETETTNETLEEEVSDDYSHDDFESFEYKPVEEDVYSAGDKFTILKTADTSYFGRDLVTTEDDIDSYYASPLIKGYRYGPLSSSVINRYSDFITSGNFITTNVDEFLEKKGIHHLTQERYKPIAQIEDIESFPTVSFFNVSSTLKNGAVKIFNTLFKDYKKKQDGSTLSIKIPQANEQVFNGFMSFIKGKQTDDIVKEFLPEDKSLYYLFSAYLDYTQYKFKDRDIDLSVILNDTFVYEDGILTIDLDRFTFNTSSVNFRYYNIDEESVQQAENPYKEDCLSMIVRLYYIILFFELVSNLAPYLHLSVLQKRQLKMDRLAEDMEEARQAFFSVLDSRLLPIEDLGHKGAQTDAERLGLSHFFIPITNDDRLCADGISVLHVHEGDEGQLLPPHSFDVLPLDDFSLKPYNGFYDDYKDILSRKVPHLVGEEGMTAMIDDDVFASVLKNHYQDWPEYETMIKTFELMQKHKLLKSKLRKHLPEIESTDKEDVIYQGYVSKIPQDEYVSAPGVNTLPDGTVLQKGLYVTIEDVDGTFEVVDITVDVTNGFRADPLLENIDTDEQTRVDSLSVLTPMLYATPNVTLNDIDDAFVDYFDNFIEESKVKIAYLSETNKIYYRNGTGVSWSMPLTVEKPRATHLTLAELKVAVSNTVKKASREGKEVYGRLFFAHFYKYDAYQNEDEYTFKFVFSDTMQVNLRSI